MSKFTGSPRLFNGIAWGVTLLVVVGMLGFAYWKIIPQQVSAAPDPGPLPTRAVTPLPLPPPGHRALDRSKP